MKRFTEDTSQNINDLYLYLLVIEAFTIRPSDEQECRVVFRTMRWTAPLIKSANSTCGIISPRASTSLSPFPRSLVFSVHHQINIGLSSGAFWAFSWWAIAAEKRNQTSCLIQNHKTQGAPTSVGTMWRATRCPPASFPPSAWERREERHRELDSCGRVHPTQSDGLVSKSLWPVCSTFGPFRTFPPV